MEALEQPAPAILKSPRWQAIHRVRRVLRQTPGVSLIRDTSEIAQPTGGHYATDPGIPDILGSVVGTCPHGCRTTRPFAFTVSGPGFSLLPQQEHCLEKLRQVGWVTGIIGDDPEEARAALRRSRKALAP